MKDREPQYYPVTTPTLELIKSCFTDCESFNKLTDEQIQHRDCLRIDKIECEHTEIIFQSFWFFWSSNQYNEYLNKLLNFPHFPIESYAENIEHILGIEKDSFSTYDESFYFDKDGQLKLLKNYHFIDAYDEYSDESSLLFYEGMNDDDCKNMINEFYFDNYICHLKLPPELYKPLNKLSSDEIEVLKMYIA